MKSSNPIELIGLRNIMESFFIFLFYGAIIILIGPFFGVDLTKDLPDQYSNLIQEPVSISMFALLSGIPLLLIFLIGILKGEKTIHHPLILKYVLPFPRTGLCAGAIIVGMLLGLGIMLWLITLGCKQGNLTSTAIQLIGLSGYFFLILLLFIILYLYLLYPWRKKIRILDIVSLSYLFMITLAMAFF
ncbi:MAG: hypothetical protein IPL51_15635 [Candidatus Competibacteraceae bacterium]|nr:hypothetical protein [Candidatus Competibacteraceae bacterium]HRD68499.1 hypothetical protein [Candidatus Competibacter sp.]